MKPSDQMLLADGTLRCRMYPAGKVAISPHLATTWFPQCDHTVSKLSADAGPLCSVKYSFPPNLKSSSNVSLTFAWITGPSFFEIPYGSKSESKLIPLSLEPQIELYHALDQMPIPFYKLP